jgi:hypothetical protein
MNEGGFVEEVLAVAWEELQSKSPLRASGVNLWTVAAKVSAVLKVEGGQLERHDKPGLRPYPGRPRKQ